ncbi:transcription factor [Fusarium beomiforme]|uniref:Transcription factor n=1 Tax=Fusarium beomiforme TaxID=44412 RepID=A0A9P5AIN6_9HYPO|nr:transcription factor [Fusarium beomiforme]
MEQYEKRGTIAERVSTALDGFSNLKKSLSRYETNDEVADATNSESSLLPEFENEFTRFKIWTGNQAAHQKGPASLDHRLRDATHLQQQVTYLLSDISQSLEEAISFISGEFPSSDRNESIERATEESTSFDILYGEDESDELDFDDGPATISLTTLLKDIAEGIDCLLRLSVAIAHPAPHERFRKRGAGSTEGVSFYTPHDIAYVRDKFPNLSTDIATILGKFITRRRQFFKYRKAHHEKLVSGLETMVSGEQLDRSQSEVIQKTLASSLPERFKMTSLNYLDAVLDEDIGSDAAISQTSYATSAGILLEDVGDKEHPPPLPSSAQDGIFECPFCYRMISAKTRKAWKRHVFSDLRPYTCLLTPCIESNSDFDRRHDWQSHISEYHWKSWSCPFRCHDPYSSVAELTVHIKARHLPEATDNELRTISSLCSQSVPENSANECLVCGYMIFGIKNYVRHVGRHLEQLALFALPTLDDGMSLEDIGEDKQNSTQLSLDEESSHDVSGAAASPNLEPLEQIRTTLPNEEKGVAHDQKSTQIRAGWLSKPPTSTTEDIEGFQLDRRTESIMHNGKGHADYQGVIVRITSIAKDALFELRRIESEVCINAAEIRAINVDPTRFADQGLFCKQEELVLAADQVKADAFQQINQLVQEVEAPGEEISKETTQILDRIATARQDITKQMDVMCKEHDLAKAIHFARAASSETEESLRAIAMGPEGISESVSNPQSPGGLVPPIETQSRDANKKVKRDAAIKIWQGSTISGYGDQYNGPIFAYEGESSGCVIPDLSGNTWTNPRVVLWTNGPTNGAVFPIKKKTENE